MDINTDSTLYTILVNDIKNKIISGELKSGEKLPSENELLDIYSLSKTTVSKSMQILANEGYIGSVSRVGNFVSQPKYISYSLQYSAADIISKISDRTEIGSRHCLELDGRYTHSLSYSILCFKQNKAAAYIENYIKHSGKPEFSDKELLSLPGMVKSLYNLHSVSKNIEITSAKMPQGMPASEYFDDSAVFLCTEMSYYDSDKELIGRSTAFYSSVSSELVLSEI